MAFRRVVHRPEQDQPQESQQRRADECRSPASSQVHDAENERGCERATDRRSAVEERHGPSAFASRKPFGDRLGRSRPVRRLRRAQKKTACGKTAKAGGQRRERGDRRVTGNGHAQSRACSDLVDQAPGDHLTAAVCRAERDDKPRKVAVGPAELDLQPGRQHTQRLTIQVVDHRRQEQQSTDEPSKMTDGAWRAHRNVVVSGSKSVSNETTTPLERKGREGR